MFPPELAHRATDRGLGRNVYLPPTSQVIRYRPYLSRRNTQSQNMTAPLGSYTITYMAFSKFLMGLPYLSIPIYIYEPLTPKLKSRGTSRPFS